MLKLEDVSLSFSSGAIVLRHLINLDLTPDGSTRGNKSLQDFEWRKGRKRESFFLFFIFETESMRREFLTE